MRVIYVMHSSSKFQGSTKSLLNMLEGLLNKGVKLHVVIPKRNDMSIIGELDYFKIPFTIMQFSIAVHPSVNNIYDFVLYMPRLLKHFIFNKVATNKIAKLALNIEADLIHTNVGPLLVGYKAAKKINLPHIWHLREYQDLDFNLKTFYSKRKFIKLLNDPLNYPIPISKGVSDHFSINKTKVIYNGVLSIKETRFIENKEKYFLFVGNLAKNAISIIPSFNEFIKHYNDYKLIFVGDTTDKNYKSSIYNLIEISNLKKNVTFLGHRDDVSELMSKATALVVPSIYEGFGRITAEAMFNGCLVIGRNSGGTKEILEKNNLGLLYSTEKDLTNHMKSLAFDGIKHFFPIIKNAQKEAVSLYSNEQNIEQIYTYYKTILSTK